MLARLKFFRQLNEEYDKNLQNMFLFFEFTKKMLQRFLSYYYGKINIFSVKSMFLPNKEVTKRVDFTENFERARVL